jgi:iron(III) transport system substrate-binding protein
MGVAVPRRAALAAIIGAAALPAACRRGDAAGKAGGGEVVLYSSADAEYARGVIGAFEKRTGVRVRLVGDTEATKTTGLVQRLLAEKDRPRADVWWSSEALGTVRLARAGVLEPYISDSAESGARAQGLDGWPRRLRGVDGTWYGFAQRARVIVYNINRVQEHMAPRTAFALTDPLHRGRVGIARPQFGTTRSHVAALVARHGEGPVREWLRLMKQNEVRLYDGNMSVVRGVAQGEVDLGLTDTDDVWAGRRNGWPVSMVFEQPVKLPFGETAGTLVIPNTVALVRGGPNPEAGRRLVDFLLSPEAERVLAASESHNEPVNPDVARDFPQNDLPDGPGVLWEDVADAEELAMRLVEEEL